MQLLSWIDPEKLNIHKLCSNPNAVDYLTEWIHKGPMCISSIDNSKIISEKYDYSRLDELSWELLSANPNALPILRQFPDRINWRSICRNRNPDILPLLTERIQQDFHSIGWFELVGNPVGVSLILEFQERFVWENIRGIKMLCTNTHPDMLPLFIANAHREPPNGLLQWEQLSKNPIALPLFRMFPERIYWNNALSIPDPDVFAFAVEYAQQNPERKILDNYSVSINPIAVPFLKANPHKICWGALCRNTNPDVLPLLMERFKSSTGKLGKLDWKSLSANPIAIPLLEKAPKLIDGKSISRNPNPDVLPLLETIARHTPDKLDWRLLSMNPVAVPLLGDFQDRINYKVFSENPAIFREVDEMDYVLK